MDRKIKRKKVIVVLVLVLMFGGILINNQSAIATNGECKTCKVKNCDKCGSYQCNPHQVPDTCTGQKIVEYPCTRTEWDLCAEPYDCTPRQCNSWQECQRICPPPTCSYQTITKYTPCSVEQCNYYCAPMFGSSVCTPYCKVAIQWTVCPDGVETTTVCANQPCYTSCQYYETCTPAHCKTRNVPCNPHQVPDTCTRPETVTYACTKTAYDTCCQECDVTDCELCGKKEPPHVAACPSGTSGCIWPSVYCTERGGICAASCPTAFGDGCCCASGGEGGCTSKGGVCSGDCKTYCLSQGFSDYYYGDRYADCGFNACCFCRVSGGVPVGPGGKLPGVVECTGSIALVLVPTDVSTGQQVQAISVGLDATCKDKTVYYRQDSCSGKIISSCSVITNGCTGVFDAPNIGGTYSYYACTDKNGDGDFNDYGEQSSHVLTVKPKTPNGEACSSDTECQSGHCKSDYDESGKWCADATQCMHNGVAYNSGQYSADSCGTNKKWYCDGGTWSCTKFNQPPSVTSPSDSPDPLTIGNSITFSATVTDPESQTTQIFVCKDATCGNCDTTSTTNCWCTTKLDNIQSKSCSYTTTDEDLGSQNYWIKACDADKLCSSPVSGSFTVIGQVKKTIAFKKGWNLFSIPFKEITLQTDDCNANSGKFYNWNTNDNIWDIITGITNIKNAKGYWFYAEKDCSIGIEGSGGVRSSDIKLFKGWNQIGAPSASVKLDSVKGTCSISKTTYFDSLAGKWVEFPERLNPYNGYWIYSENDCSFE